MNSMSSDFADMTLVPQPKPGKKKSLVVEASLEEVYHGFVKRIQHARKTLAEDGSVSSDFVELTVDIKPGTAEGTRFVFESMGNKLPGHNAGPAVYTLSLLPHDRFKRQGDDLVHYVTLPISKALCGASLDITTLDGRKLTVPVAEIITPGKTMTILGEGMVKKESPKSRGDLIIEFDLLFPPALTETQRKLIKAAFLLPTKPTEVHDKAVKAFLAEAYGQGVRKVPDGKGEGGMKDVQRVGWVGGVESE